MAHEIHEGTSLRPEQAAVVPMSIEKRLGGEALMWGVPALIFGVIGLIAGPALDLPAGASGLAAVMLWTAILIGLGIRINGEQEFSVIERLGELVRIQPKGMYVIWFPGMIDKFKCRDTFMAKEVPLFQGPGHMMDFIDGSTEVSITAWYHIANPAHVADKAWDLVFAQVTRWVYAVDGAPARLVSILEANFSPLIQAHTIEDARLFHEDCAELAVRISRPALEQIGAYPRPEQAIVVDDILISADIVALRQLKMEGEMNAQKAANQSRGYSQSILNIIEDAKKAGQEISWPEARELFERQRGLETIERTGANVTFVGPDVSGVLKTLDIGRKG